MLAWKIALRYLLAKKSHRAVNVISMISMAGVAVATAAIVIVMSVFNGFADLAHSRLTILEPDIKVIPVRGKIIAGADSVARMLGGIEGVRAAYPTVTERALLISRDSQRPVIVHAVPDEFAQAVPVDSAIIYGAYLSVYGDDYAGAMSVGVAVALHLRPDPEERLTLYAPRRGGRINPTNPAASFMSIKFVPTSVVRSSQEKFDNDGVIIPLSAARELFGLDSEASAIELSLNPGADAGAVKSRISELLPDVSVMSRLEQLADVFRMIEIEKWVTFLLLAFILVVASFNIISTLSLLVIEKRDNMSTLRALGAPAAMCRKIFVIEGWLITTLGGVIGIIIGAGLALMQQIWGVITLRGDESTLLISTYPCRLAPTDLMLILLLIVTLGFIIAQSTRLFSK